MSTDTYTCDSCGGTFEKGWTDAEAAAEAQGNFPGIDVTDRAEAGVVCDDCYQHIMARARAEAPELIGEGWRGEAADPIGDALHADAEAARAEIRSADLICPSCGGNYGDLFGRHCLIMSWGETGFSRETWRGHPVAAVIVGKPWCECRDGQRVSLDTATADYETIKAAANISLGDQFWFQETMAFRDIIGEGPSRFTGLLGIIGGE